jgi:esterase/lipase superfamily enzyme
MQREYYSWWSDRLHRNMELLVFGGTGAKVLVFPTRCGRFYEYEQLRMTEVLKDKILAGQIQLYCLDSIDSESLYSPTLHPADRIRRHCAYEAYILNEVLPFMQTHNPNPNVIAHGCSLGAYHAINIAARHPGIFRKVAAFSGRYDLTMTVKHYRDLFDGFYNDDIYFNTPTHFLPNLTCPSLLNDLRSLHIVLAVGEEDAFRDNNEYLSQILQSKGIDHEIYFWRGVAHQGHEWRQMARIYM